MEPVATPPPVELSELSERYYELLWAVETKHPGESRHQTALRYIRERETGGSDAGGTARVAAPKEEGVMMLRFRKKPVVIEAFQMTEARRRGNSEWPEWLNRAWNENRDTVGSVSCQDYPHSDGTDRLQIQTLEGVMHVEWNDWIIQGVKGELYPCKPDIFEATYEPVE